MKQYKIELPLINDIKDFVNIVSKQNYHIEAESGRYKVDAKSIMGIFSLDLTKPIEVQVHTDDADGIAAELAPFIA